MCGIAGFVAAGLGSEDALQSLVTRMAEALGHRGPDDSGFWTDAAAGVALGHRRLKVIDLSAGGSQPMISHSGRLVLTYNGEIYNYKEIRKELESKHQRFRSESDTEVLLGAIEVWGIHEALLRVNGMFAFGVWDRSERSLILARDRFGEKPLFWGGNAGELIFASELKALRRFPRFDSTVNATALSEYLRWGYVPSPLCLLSAYQKVPPGNYVIAQGSTIRTVSYWDAADVAVHARRSPQADPADAEDLVDVALRDSVRSRLVSDVPLGAFLSGGIDSSLVVAVMQAESSGTVRTFTIGSGSSEYDESIAAAGVAAHLGTDHTTLEARPTDALELIPEITATYDEPIGDSSQLPTMLLSRLTRKHVTVALSGDGGDELFGGYNRHVFAANQWRLIRRFSPRARATAANALERLPAASVRDLYSRAERMLPPQFRQRLPDQKVRKLASALRAETPEDLYLRSAGRWLEPPLLLADLADVQKPPVVSNDLTFEDFLMLRDTLSYLPDDILVKVDRAAMGVGLETRTPYLDPAVFELAWRLPSDMRIRKGTGKWILRRVLERYVPAELTQRPKTGFGVDLNHWLRGPLRPWAEDHLTPQRLSSTLLDPAHVRVAWQRHLSGEQDLEQLLWPILCYVAWHDFVWK